MHHARARAGKNMASHRGDGLEVCDRVTCLEKVVPLRNAHGERLERFFTVNCYRNRNVTIVEESDGAQIRNEGAQSEIRGVMKDNDVLRDRCNANNHDAGVVQQ
jgi:hypothetical protein